MAVGARRAVRDAVGTGRAYQLGSCAVDHRHPCTDAFTSGAINPARTDTDLLYFFLPPGQGDWKFCLPDGEEENNLSQTAEDEPR